MREALDGALPALLDLRWQGVVRAVGLGVNKWEVCREVAQRADVDCFLLAGRYYLLEQEAATELLPLCRERGIGIIIGGPFNTGILATGSVAPGTYNYAPAPADIIEARAAHRERCSRAIGVPLVGRRARLSPARSRGRDGNSRPGVARGGRRRRGHIWVPISRCEVWAELRAEGLLR